MRRHTATLAVLALALALPSSAFAATALPTSVKTQAGILPTSPFSFIDKAFDSLSIAVALTPTAKTDAALKVAQESAAEAAVMSEAGNVALTTTSVANVEKALATATASASQVTAPDASAALQLQLQTSAAAAQATLNLGLAAAPDETKPQIEAIVAPAIAKLSTAPTTVPATDAAAAPKPAGCDGKQFASCVQDSGCTAGTSEKCFLACPPKTVPCQSAATGKTCSVPDTTCVNSCLQKIIGCSDSCLTQAGCTKTEVSTSSLQIIPPEQVQKAFQLQLQGGLNLK